MGCGQLPRCGWARPLAGVAFLIAALLTPAMVAAQATPAAATGTPRPELRTVGDLMDRIDAAWRTVRTIRSVTTIEISERNATPEAAGTPGATEGQVVIEQVAILPDRKHLTYYAEGVDVGDVIVIDGAIYARGEQARQLGATNSDTWVKVDLGQFAANTPQRQGIEALLAPISAPLAALSPVWRGLLLQEAGTATIGGRTCHLYHLNPPPVIRNDGPRTIGIDAAGFPCQITVAVSIDTRMITTSETYLAFNEPLAIEPPAVGTRAN